MYVATFKTRFNIPQDVDIEYYHEGEIEDQRLPWVVFFPLMAILDGEVRFPIDTFLLKTLSIHGLSPDQCLSNFYKVVSFVGHLNRLYNLKLRHRDINFMYSI